MLDALAPGDIVTVTRIDRLARSTFDLFGIVKRARPTTRWKKRVARAKAKGLFNHFWRTDTPSNTLTGTHSCSRWNHAKSYQSRSPTRVG